MTNYTRFLQSKRITAAPAGVDVTPEQINPLLFPFQRDIVRWALRRGRAAVFADCGLGKTPVQLEWARHVALHTGGEVLILAPLAVAQQTAREGGKFAIGVTVCRTQADVQPGINIANYEMLHHFDPAAFAGIVLDESSILKAFGGVMRQQITAFGQQIPYRLCCTATPAPNDLIELTNHAEFLDVMSGKEIIALFFTQDGNTTHAWRLKGHARQDFWRWMASWSVALRKPSDLGYEDDGFILPELRIKQVTVESPAPTTTLFPVEALSLQERQQARRESTGARVEAVIDLVHTESLCYNARYEQTTNRRTTSGPQGVHETVSTAESAQMEANARATAESECSQQGVVCTGRSATDQGTSTSEGLADIESRQTKESASQTAWDRTERLPGSGGNAAGDVCDLRVLRPVRSELLPGSGSRPQNGQSSRVALRKLQSRTGEVQGRSESAHIGHDVSSEKWLIWCDLNTEQDALCRGFKAKSISYVSVEGKTSPEHRIAYEEAWRLGDVQVMISKPTVFGFGMNWQHCHNVAFVGLSDSYEQFYQAMRRCWRFGQQQPVRVHLITAETEGAVVKNIERKEAQARDMMDNIVRHMADLALDGAQQRDEMEYKEDIARGPNWTLYLGDCVTRIDEIETESVGLSVFSPPFPGMYAYTNSVHDIGNTTSIDEFMEHFAFLAPKLLRVTMPGRMCCIHLMQLTAMKSRDGYIGVKDYRGKTIAMMEDAGWVYAGEVTIDKNPQIQATRNKERGLLFKTLATDSSLMRMALADYLIYFRKPGENPFPIRAGISSRYDNPNGWITEREWIEWAAPVWYRQTKDYPGGIRETDVLNVAQARETDDERHLCPLQLGVIERAIKLWSMPGDTILSPFAGVGSEGYQAIKFGRRFVGIELKESYWYSAIRNLQTAEHEKEQPTLFDLTEAAV